MTTLLVEDIGLLVHGDANIAPLRDTTLVVEDGLVVGMRDHEKRPTTGARLWRTDRKRRGVRRSVAGHGTKPSKACTRGVQANSEEERVEHAAKRARAHRARTVCAHARAPEAQPCACAHC